MNYTYQPKKFNFVKSLTWSHINEQMLMGVHEGKNDVTLLYGETTGRYSDYKGLLLNILMQMNREPEGWNFMHIYHSRVNKGVTAGRHNDETDVMIVQAVGKMMYRFDDGSEVIMNPSDALYIPVGMYHEPVIIGPRITLSFAQ